MATIKVHQNCPYLVEGGDSKIAAQNLAGLFT